MCSDTVSRQTGNLSARVIECQGCRVRVHRHTLFPVPRPSVASKGAGEPLRPWLLAPVIPCRRGAWGWGNRQCVHTAGLQRVGLWTWRVRISASEMQWSELGCLCAWQRTEVENAVERMIMPSSRLLKCRNETEWRRRRQHGDARVCAGHAVVVLRKGPTVRNPIFRDE